MFYFIFVIKFLTRRLIFLLDQSLLKSFWFGLKIALKCIFRWFWIPVRSNQVTEEVSVRKKHFFGANVSVGNFKQPFTKPLEPTSINCTYGYKKRNSNFLILLSRLLYLTIEERISVRKAKMSTKFLFIDCHHIIIICEKELNEATNKLFLALKPIQTILRLVQLN